MSSGEKEKSQYVHIIKYSSAIRSEWFIYAKAWMDFKNFMLDERSQTQRR